MKQGATAMIENLSSPLSRSERLQLCCSELSRKETVKSGGTGILPVSAQHGQDGHATLSVAVLLLSACSAKMRCKSWISYYEN